jgi:hypothetical protein
VYAAVDGQGLWCSNTQGRIWIRASGDPGLTITALAQVGTHIVAGTLGDGIQLYPTCSQAPGSFFALPRAPIGVPPGVLGLSFASVSMFKEVPASNPSSPANSCDPAGQTGAPLWAHECFLHYQRLVNSTVRMNPSFTGNAITPPVWDDGDQADTVCPRQGSPHVVQYFERVRLEYCLGLPNRVGLTPLGRVLLPLRYHKGACQPAANTGANGVGQSFDPIYTQETESSLGVPISPPIYEVNGDGTGYAYQVQYLTNARLELHPDINDPRFQIELGLLGTEYLDSLWQTTGLACR